MIFAAGGGATEPQRHIQIDFAVEHAKHLKHRRQHADDGSGLAVDGDRAAYNRGVRGIAALPETVAQYEDAIAARLLFFGKERAAERRHGAQKREKIGGDAEALRALRFARPGYVGIDEA